MTEEEKKAQITGGSTEHGFVGICARPITARRTRRRSSCRKHSRNLGRKSTPTRSGTTLPATLVVAEEREREIYGVTDQIEINRVLRSYSDFVTHRIPRRRRCR